MAGLYCVASGEQALLLDTKHCTRARQDKGKGSRKGNSKGKAKGRRECDASASSEKSCGSEEEEENGGDDDEEEEEEEDGGDEDGDYSQCIAILAESNGYSI
jgi:hypothetical protein